VMVPALLIPYETVSVAVLVATTLEKVKVNGGAAAIPTATNVRTSNTTKDGPFHSFLLPRETRGHTSRWPRQSLHSTLGGFSSTEPAICNTFTSFRRRWLSSSNVRFSEADPENTRR
jgi:hypothetical protein